MRAGVLALLLIMSGPSQAAPTFEADVLDEINYARANPQQFARILREFRQEFGADGAFRQLGSGQIFASREGVRAVDEAIGFMERQRPLPPLAASDLLGTVAADHTADQGASGQFGHRSRDGKMPADRAIARGGGRYVAETISYGTGHPIDVVIQLIVDDGVPDRGHRTILFDPRFRHAGASCGAHRTYQMMCTINFAITETAR